MTDYLSRIVARKRSENVRRRRHVGAMCPVDRVPQHERSKRGIQALRRTPGQTPAVLAEIKFRSPSAGVIRLGSVGEGVRIARSYQCGGASVISVLADGPGFGGSPLLVRAVARAVDIPVLYKEFVLDPVQVDLAYDVGASLVLLVLRILNDRDFRGLVEHVRLLGMEPLVEVANPREVDRALGAGSTIIGVNARDLSTFAVNTVAARECIERVPQECVAVFMSGVRSVEDFRSVAQSRADALLIGEGLMGYPDPGARLAELLRAV